MTITPHRNRELSSSKMIRIAIYASLLLCTLSATPQSVDASNTDASQQRSLRRRIKDAGKPTTNQMAQTPSSNRKIYELISGMQLKPNAKEENVVRRAFELQDYLTQKRKDDEVRHRRLLNGLELSADDQVVVQRALEWQEYITQKRPDENDDERHRQLATCGKDALWHPATGDFYACSNDSDYPPAWNHPMARGAPLFDTQEECCSSMFPGYVCGGTVDVCNTMTAQQWEEEDCEDKKGKGWHPMIGATLKCSNNKDYPENWNREELEGLTMFETPERCCEEVGPSCTIDDVCGVSVETPCEEKAWHFSTLTGQSCTNDDVYPPVWKNVVYDGVLMFQTKPECCAKLEAETGDECFVVDTCRSADDSQVMPLARAITPSDPPSSPPSTSPTRGPTSSPVLKPAIEPAPKDTMEVSCSERKFHPSSITAMKCTNNHLYPNKWNKAPLSFILLFDTPQACCEAFYDIDCVVEDVCTGTDDSGGAPQVTTTMGPKINPTMSPTMGPTMSPTTNPTMGPTVNPTGMPTKMPTQMPTQMPTGSPVKTTSAPPTASPTMGPTMGPTVSPTTSPTRGPTKVPSGSPIAPSKSPTMAPTVGPTMVPTTAPTRGPSRSPTTSPTGKPASAPGALCPDEKWHRSTAPGAIGVCTNSDDYPGAWDDPTQSKFFLIDTAEACCTDLFPGSDCTIVDVCTPNCMEEWHPSVTNQGSCTNSLDSPPEWSEGGLRDTMMFASAEECCTEYFSGAECDTFDACSEQAASIKPSKWYADRSKGACVSGSDYSDELGSEALFEFEMECCHASGFCGIGAKKSSVSPTMSPTSSPTTQSPTTQSPTVTSSSKASMACEDRKFYPKSATDKRCLNDNNYPESWNSPKLSARFLFDSGEECCTNFYKGDCSIVDDCIEVSPSPKPTMLPTPSPTLPTLKSTPERDLTLEQKIELRCGNNKFYPGSESSKSCSNDDNNPDFMNNAPEKFFFNTGSQCCDRWFEGSFCLILDECAKEVKRLHNTAVPTSSPTTSAPTECSHTRKWHPYKLFMQRKYCTDDLDFPPSWEDTTGFIFDSGEECCKKFYPDGDCRMFHVPCATDTPSRSPSGQPSITTAPTNELTAAPITPPTSSPSRSNAPSFIYGENCPEQRWHPRDVGGGAPVCTNDMNIMPHWLTPGLVDGLLFDTAEGCCAAWYGETCILDDDCR